MKSNLFKFFAAIFCVAICAGFTSCSDDDDDNEASALVGSWLEVGYVQSDGQIYWESEPDCSMTFNADGTVVSYYEDEVDATGTYSVNGNYFVANMVDPSYPEDRWTNSGTFAIQDDLLYLSYLEEEDGEPYTFTYVYRRIR